MDIVSISLKIEIIDDIHKGVSKKSIKLKYNLIEDEYLQLYNETVYIIGVIKQIKDLSKININEALRLCEKEEYISYFLIQVQRVKMLIKLERYDEAISICENPLYLDSSRIQYQKILALMEKEDEESLKEALALCNRFPRDFQIQTLKISLLMQLGNFELALMTASKKEFRHYIPIQVKIVDILLSQDKIEEALSFLKDERFKDCIQMQKRLKKLDKIPREHTSSASISIREQITDIEAINSLEIPESKRMILTVAFYEKNNYPINAILNYLKHQKEVFYIDHVMLKIIKCLVSHVKERNKVLNYAFYESMMSKV